MNKVEEDITIKSKGIIATAEAFLCWISQGRDKDERHFRQPDYELCRFCDPKPGKDDVRMLLTAGDWETLTGAYGPMAIEARFSNLYTTATNPKRI